jgi:DNA-binding MurR/RpiR family transcriptional regulator
MTPPGSDHVLQRLTEALPSMRPSERKVAAVVVADPKDQDFKYGLFQ